MFFVYSGYINPDNADSSNGPTHTLKMFNTEKEVIADREEFEEALGRECSDVYYVVIDGKERPLVESKKVVTWSLS